MPLLDFGADWPPKPHDRVADVAAEVLAWWTGSQDQLDGQYSSNSHRTHSDFQYSGGVIGKVARWFWGAPPTPGKHQARRIHLTLGAEIIQANAAILFGEPLQFAYAGDSPEQLEEKKAKAAARQAKKDAKNPFLGPGGADGAAGGVAVPTDDDQLELDLPEGELPGANNPAPPPEDAEIEEEPGESQAARDRLDLIWNSKWMHAAMQKAAELQGAFGGVYGRIVVDPEVREHAWIDFVPANRAIPEFRWDKLRTVTFWTDLASEQKGRDKDAVYRHLEKHEPGWVYHALYKGSATELGVRVPWADHSSMATLIVSDPAQGRDATGLDEAKGELAVGYIPNASPNPEWINSPQLAPLGRPDLTPDLISLLDVIDEVYTSLIRDVRIAKSRLVVTGAMTSTQGPGKGSEFDLDQEVYDLMPGDPNSQSITSVQFNIRTEDHLRIVSDLSKQVVRKAGFSPFTFGLEDDAAPAMTATETEAKEKATISTRKSKIIPWMSFLEEMVPRTMTVDEFHFAVDGAAPELDDSLEITWPAMAKDSDQTRADFVSTLKTAGLVSLYVGLKYVHPDWTDDQVYEEIDRLEEEGSLADPATLMASMDQPTADDEDPDADPDAPSVPVGGVGALPAGFGA